MAEIERRPAQRRRPIAFLASGAAHAALLAAIFLVQPGRAPPPQPEIAPIPVMLAPPPPEPPPPEPEPEPKPAPKAPEPAPKAAKPTPKKAPEKKPPPPPRVVARAKPAPPDVIPLPAAKAAGYGYTEASDAQVAGASQVDGGGGGGGGGTGAGGGCNMARRLQTALRKDRMAQAAMAEAHRGKPILMWNGAWVRHPSQEGEGLASVREAILWEVGFAPEACRKEQVRGMIVLSMNDAPGSARLVVGSGQWRWSDLLFTRGVVRR